MTEKKMHDIGWYSGVACNKKESPTGLKECGLLKPGAPIFRAQEKDIVKMDVKKFKIDCNLIEKMPHSRDAETVIDNVRCAVDSMQDPSYLECKCGREHVYPSLDSKNGDEIERIDVHDEDVWGRKTLTKTVVLSDLGKRANVKMRKSGPEIRTGKHSFHVGKNVRVNVGTCGAVASFMRDELPSLSDKFISGIGFLFGKLVGAEILSDDRIEISPSILIPKDPLSGLNDGNGLVCAFTFDRREGEKRKKSNLSEVDCFGSACIDRVRYAYENSGEIPKEYIDEETGEKRKYYGHEIVKFISNDVPRK